MLKFIRRIRLFARRFVTARKCGFTYRGTTRTPFPRSIKIAGRIVHLAPPAGQTCVLDVFNVLLDDEYGLASLSFTPRVILDIGANIGIFALAAKRYYPEVEIYCYEPSPKVAQVAQANLKGFANISVYQEAVGGAQGMCDILAHEQSRLTRTCSSPTGAVAVTSLQQAVQRAGGKINLLKMDCEGAEWEMFHHARDVLAAIPEIRMEYHLTDGHTLDEFIATAISAGHRITRLTHNGNHGIAWLSAS